MGSRHILSEKTAATLESTRLVAYPVTVVLMNVSSPYRRSLVENALTLLLYLPLIKEIGQGNMKSCGVGQKSSKYWFTGTNEVEAKEMTTWIDQSIMGE